MLLFFDSICSKSLQHMFYFLIFGCGAFKRNIHLIQLLLSLINRVNTFEFIIFRRTKSILCKPQCDIFGPKPHLNIFYLQRQCLHSTIEAKQKFIKDLFTVCSTGKKKKISMHLCGFLIQILGVLWTLLKQKCRKW